MRNRNLWTRGLVGLALVVGLWSGGIATAQTTGGRTGGKHAEISNEAEARPYFIEMERITRLPKTEQSQQVAHVYRDLFPPLEARYYSQAVSPPVYSRTLTPEQAADILAPKGWVVLQEAGWQRCHEFLMSHRQELASLVKGDLGSGDNARISPAIHAAGTLQLQEVFPALLAVFQKNDALADQAAYALRDLNDPRAIRPLIERYSGDPTKFYDLLDDLSRNRKPDPALLRLLESDSAQVRWQAAYALSACGDASLEPSVAKLLGDPAPKVRAQAAVAAFSLPAASQARLRPALVSLLRDPDATVRFQTATNFAWLHDLVCAPALLGLLRERALEPILESNVVQAINTLTGSYFGYEIGQPSQLPTNQAALDRFETWIKEHPKA